MSSNSNLKMPSLPVALSTLFGSFVAVSVDKLSDGAIICSIYTLGLAVLYFVKKWYNSKVIL